MPSPARASLHRSAAIAPAGQSRDANEDDAGPIRRPRCAIAEERSVPRPARWTVPPLEAISKDLAFETVSTRRCGYAPLVRFLMLATAGSAEGRSFPLRSPVKDKSNAG